MTYDPLTSLLQENGLHEQPTKPEGGGLISERPKGENGVKWDELDRARPSFLPPESSLSGALAPRVESPEQRIRELEAAVAQQEQQLEGLLNIAASLRQSTTPEEAMRAIVVQISHLLGADRTTIYEMSEDQETLHGLAVQGSASIKVMIKSGRGIAGLVAQERRLINLRDAYEHPNFDVRVDRHTGYRTRSVLCVPMFGSRGEVIGVVQVLNKLTGSFSKEDQNLLCALAAQAAITLESQRRGYAIQMSNESLIEAKEQLSRKLEEQELLFEIEQCIASSVDIHQIAEAVLARAARVVRSEHVGLFVVTDDEHGPGFLKTSGLEEVLPLSRVTLGEGIMGKVASRGEDFILVGDTFEREAIPRSLCDRCGVEVVNALAASLFDGNRVIGSIVFVNCDVLEDELSTEEPSEEELNLEARLNSDSSWLDSLAELGGSFEHFDEVPLSNETYQDRLLALRFVSLIARQLGRGVAAAMKRRVEEQQTRLMSIGQMLSGVLHDLRGPMTSISGYTQLMIKADDREKRERLAQTVLNKIKSFNEMAMDVISFARGERRVLWRKVFLSQFIESVLEALKHEFEEHHVQLDIENNAGGIAFFDEGKMRRVVVNIARNARQAIGREGEVKWTLDRTDHDLIFIISDNGPGIPAAIRDRVFELFLTMGKEEGTGLGLSIVKQIIDDHEGDIDLWTQTGQGTRFTLSIPQNERNEEQSSNAKRSS